MKRRCTQKQKTNKTNAILKRVLDSSPPPPPQINANSAGTLLSYAQKNTKTRRVFRPLFVRARGKLYEETHLLLRGQAPVFILARFLFDFEVHYYYHREKSIDVESNMIDAGEDHPVYFAQ